MKGYLEVLFQLISDSFGAFTKCAYNRFSGTVNLFLIVLQYNIAGSQ